MKINLLLLFILILNYTNAQINIDTSNLTIETELPDTLQRIYEDFLNEQVERISIITLKKKYNHLDYYYFLKNKKFFESRKKWIKYNSHEESIIREGYPPRTEHIDSVVFNHKFLGVEKEFIKAEYFLDSTDTRKALKEMFNGKERGIEDMCYIPRHAVLFYNANNDIVGIYEVCFQCRNVKIGIVGTKMFSKFSPYIESLFEKHKEEL